jgi:hypothetical protein
MATQRTRPSCATTSLCLVMGTFVILPVAEVAKCRCAFTAAARARARVARLGSRARPCV